MFCSICRNTGPILRRCSKTGCSEMICSSISDEQGCYQYKEGPPLCLIHIHKPKQSSVHLSLCLSNQRQVPLTSKMISYNLFESNNDIESLETYITKHIETKYIESILDSERTDEQLKIYESNQSYIGIYSNSLSFYCSIQLKSFITRIHSIFFSNQNPFIVMMY
jgi:hypothetical protein